jgi:23S rRNA pseudouridine1911/1915/1917 synthase
MKILFCDNHLLIVSKPAGISTQPHEGERRNATDEAKAWVKKEFHKPGAVFLEPVHRLDKPVSGIVLFARTSKALSRLQEAMRERKMKKVYVACVEGVIQEDSGTLEHRLVHETHLARVHPEGKPALLEYKVMERGARHTVLEVVLVTGRYHQIRAQFSAIGHPLIGDQKYGASTFHEEIALHHGRLELTHPVTQEPLVVVDTAPQFVRR